MKNILVIHIKETGGLTMLLIGLFSKYFLILMVLQGIVVGFIDAGAFKRNKMRDTAIKARILGIGSIVLGIALYILRRLT